MMPRPPINIRSAGQRSRSQGHKMQKGDRVAGMSYTFYRVPIIIIIIIIISALQSVPS